MSQNRPTVGKDGATVMPSQSVRSRHTIAVMEALVVTVLWSSSWVLIKFGLQDVPPLIFSGLRYSVASAILLGVILARPKHRTFLKSRNRRWWGSIAAYGTIFVAITQGAQYVGLRVLDAITVSMLLNLTPILVLLLGSSLLREVPPPRQVALILLGVLGAIIYVYPVQFDASQAIGLTVVIVGVIANAVSSIMGRSINRERDSSPVVVTGLSMTVGSILLLAVGLAVEGVVSLTPLSIVYVVWLSVVNTAFAFTLWNRAMHTLRAVDMSIINSTMMPQIALLAVWFLSEMPTILDWVGLAVLGISVVLVQVDQARKLASNQGTKTGDNLTDPG